MEVEEHDFDGLGLMESFNTLKAVMNRNSSNEQSCKLLCLALPFCCIHDGDTWKTGRLYSLGSTKTPCSSSSSHFACCKSLHFLLNCGTNTLVGGGLLLNVKSAKKRPAE